MSNMLDARGMSNMLIVALPGDKVTLEVTGLGAIDASVTSGAPVVPQRSSFVSDNGASDASAFDTHLYVNGSVEEEQATSLLVAAANTCYAHRALCVQVESSRRIHTAS
jgi:hypothetical protein